MGVIEVVTFDFEIPFPFKKLAEVLVPDTVSMGVLLRVLKNLLQEQVPVRDVRTMSEA